MTYKILFCTLSCTLALSSCDSGSDSSTPTGSANTTNISNDLGTLSESSASGGNGANTALEATYQIQIFNKINASRVAAGLATLSLDSRVTALALDHNQYMANVGSRSASIIISHDNFSDRANAMFALGYNSAGENVAAEQGFAVNDVTDFFVDSWNDSAGHRENIVGNYTHTGISVYVNVSDGRVYATQLFAR